MEAGWSARTNGRRPSRPLHPFSRRIRGVSGIRPRTDNARASRAYQSRRRLLTVQAAEKVKGETLVYLADHWRLFPSVQTSSASAHRMFDGAGVQYAGHSLLQRQRAGGGSAMRCAVVPVPPAADLLTSVVLLELDPSDRTTGPELRPPIPTSSAALDSARMLSLFRKSPLKSGSEPQSNLQKKRAR